MSEQRVYQGRTFDVVIQRVTLPHGHAADLEIVQHRGSVVLVPIAGDGRVLMVRQYRHAAAGFLWELPAGTREEGEPLEVTAARECQEELGLVAGHVERLQTLYPSPGFCTEAMTFFRLSALRPPGSRDRRLAPDADEAFEVAAMDPAEVWRMVARGDVRDLKTVAGMVLAGLLPAV